MSTATDEVGQRKMPRTHDARINGYGGVFIWKSAMPTAVGTVMTVLTLSVTLARATSPKGEALLNV